MLVKPALSLPMTTDKDVSVRRHRISFDVAVSTEIVVRTLKAVVSCSRKVLSATDRGSECAYSLVIPSYSLAGRKGTAGDSYLPMYLFRHL